VRINASTYYYRNIPCSWYFKKRPHERKHDRTPQKKGYLKPAEVANMANFLISENTKSISVKYLKWIME
jgi:hypothetical protein